MINLKKITKQYLLCILLFCSYLSYSQGEFVVEIDRTNGNYTKIGTAIPGITFVFPDDRAFDESTGAYFFPSSQVDHRLYSINTINGAMNSNPLVGNISKFEYDNTTNTLYGLENDAPNNVKYFVSINPVTGVQTPIGNPISGSGLYGADYSAFDEINHVYYILDPSNTPPFPELITINATNGNIITNPVMAMAMGENIINITYDNSSGTLYGLLQDNNLQKFFLISIDATAGTYSKIGIGTIFGTGGGSATIDELNQEYIYMYSNSIGYNITTLDITTGDLAHNALIIPFTNNDNFYSVKYDRVQQRLFSIHWETISLGVETPILNNSEIVLYPNPTKDLFYIETELASTYTLVNFEGKILQSGKLNTGNNMLDVSLCASGLYFVDVRTNNASKIFKLIKL